MRHTDRFYSECQRMVEERAVDDLARTYKLLSRSPRLLHPMLQSFASTVTAVGLEAVAPQGDAAAKARALKHSGT